MVSERRTVARQPPDGGHRLAALRGPGVEPVHGRRPRGADRGPDGGRNRRIRRFPAVAGTPHRRRRGAYRPPHPHRHGVGSAGGHLAAGRTRRSAEGDGEQGLPQPSAPRTLHVRGEESRSEARTAVELRTFVDPAAGRRKRVVRRQPLLYRGRGHHPARQGRRPQHPAQPGPDRKLGRGGRRRMAHRRGMERQCQLQLAPDGVSRAGVPRTQTLRRRRFREGPLVGVDGRAVHRRALHGGGSRSGSPGSGIRALEPARVAARKPFADDLRPGRKPAGRTL